ncbi:transcription termination factor NusA [Candidatus Saccharibacteria bacterium]|nr:transcription termination factor NusA [Candidatus Saccharibacteria bacterium]
METLDLKQMIPMVKILADEKNLSEEIVLAAIETAIAAAWRREHGEREQNVRSILDVNSGTATVYVMREVIEDEVGYIPAKEIPLAEAKALKKDAAIGDIVEESHEVSTLGRIASQTAKQVLMQALREAEREAVLAMFEDSIGTIINGRVTRVEPKIIRIDIGGSGSAIMPISEQIEGERHRVGEQLKVYLKGIERDERGVDMIVSRGAKEFIDLLFRQEVPELSSGSVSVKGIAREAGRRTKIAVASEVPGVDPVGSFVGGRGVRVQAVQNEIGDREKIDIIAWSDNVAEFIRAALQPAEISKIDLDEKAKRAKVYTTEDQQAIAIGRQGQNVRLASQLTGYDLDIEILEKKAKPKTSKKAEDSLLSAIASAK